MKRQEPIRIGELIRKAIANSGSTETYNAQKVCYLWAEAVGPAINRYTTARWVKNDELHVTIASGVVKNEVSFNTETILRRLNDLAGTSENPPIRKIVVH